MSIANAISELEEWFVIPAPAISRQPLIPSLALDWKPRNQIDWNPYNHAGKGISVFSQTERKEIAYTNFYFVSKQIRISTEMK